MHGLVAAYGETLRAETPSLVWSVRGGEPAIGTPRSLWPARRLFNDVHDAVFADVRGAGHHREAENNQMQLTPRERWSSAADLGVRRT